MKLTFFPKTKTGKWSVITMVSNIILFIFASVLPWKSGFTGFRFILQNPIQSVITILMLFIGILTCYLGFISIFKGKERAILVFLSILAGLYSVLGFIGSIKTLFFD